MSALALSGYPTSTHQCPFLGVKRTWPGLIAVSANDFGCDAAQFSISNVVPSPSPTLVLGSQDRRRRKFMAAAALGFFREHRDDNQHT